MKIKSLILIPLLLLATGLIAQTPSDSLLRTCPDASQLHTPRVICTYGYTSTSAYADTGFSGNRIQIVDSGDHSISEYTYPSIPPVYKSDSIAIEFNNYNSTDNRNAAESATFLYRVDTGVSNILQFHYAIVQVNASDSTLMKFEILDSLGMSTCHTLEVASDTNSGWISGSFGIMAKDWTTHAVRLDAYDGQLIQIRVTAYHRSQDYSQRDLGLFHCNFSCVKNTSDTWRESSITHLVSDTNDDCEVQFVLHANNQLCYAEGGDTVCYDDPCINNWWYITRTDTVPDTIALAGNDVHTPYLSKGSYAIALHYALADLSTHDSIIEYITIDDFCHCYDTVYDTIVENQLPWTTYDTAFNSDIDTTLFFPGPGHPVCDTIIDYHLKVWWNIVDTADQYICTGELPFTFDSIVMEGEGTVTDTMIGPHGQDSIVYFRLHIIPGTDTTIYDTVLENQLPWFFFDTLFNDSVDDYSFVTFNEAGCDSTIHYNLHVFWNGDHCDTTLSFGNVVTPNGDGVNDKFIIGGLLSNDCYRWNDLTIYDRTGHVVYHHKNIARDEDWWDPGADRIPSGTYFYVFKAHGVTIQTQHNGVIEVLREK